MDYQAPSRTSRFHYLGYFKTSAASEAEAKRIWRNQKREIVTLLAVTVSERAERASRTDRSSSHVSADCEDMFPRAGLTAGRDLAVILSAGLECSHGEQLDHER